MSPTVNSLLADRRLGLTLVGGGAGADRPITWAHAIELEDPTAWLSGGELVMTTGMMLSESPERQRAYASRLHANGATALAVDTGTVHGEVPAAVCAEGEARGFPVLAVARDVPFIAIVRAVADALSTDAITAANGVAGQQQRLARAALAGGIPAVADELAGALDADVVVVDAAGAIAASAGSIASDAEATALLARVRSGARGSSGARVDSAGHVISAAFGPAGAQRGQILVATRDALQASQRLLVGHAATVISIEARKPARVIATEQRLRAALLRALFGGVLDDDLGQLGYFGFTPQTDVTVLVLADVGTSTAAGQLIDRVLGETGVPYLSAADGDALVVLLPGARADAMVATLHQALQRGLRRTIGGGVGLRVPLPDAARSRRQAMAAARAGRIGGRRLLCFDELSTYDLMLGGQSREALAEVAAAALGPLERYDAARSGDLVHSLEVFLAHNGQSEAAAGALGVHRHTMRNRMDKVSELLGKNVQSAHVRAELWLAVKARELVGLWS